MPVSARPLSSASTLALGVDRKDQEPLQSQIARQIREMVLGGRLKPRTRLPSTRVLAAELQVARATVVEAFEQLSGEGYLETRMGSGTVVAAELPDQLLSSGRKPAQSHVHARKVPSREPARPFRSGLVDWEHFPHDEWGRILGRFWRNPPITLLEHNDAFGWLPLRQAIAHHLFEWRGITCDAGQVIITSGGPDAFDLIRRAAFKPGDRFWQEDPGYPTAERVFTQGGMVPVHVPVDADGLIVSEAMSLAPKARCAFVTPARHYPTGVTMPLSRRLELLQWAKDADALVVEDDYDSEYRYVGRPLPALMSLDRSERVIYSGTFSKVFSPIIRLGFLVVPMRLAATMRAERKAYGAPPSLLVQPALAQFMDQGHFALHIRRMRRIYAARRETLIKTLEHNAGDRFTVDAPPSGLSVLLRFVGNADDQFMARKLASEGIECQPLSSYQHGSPAQEGLLLGFAGFAAKDLEASAVRLAALLANYLPSRAKRT
jgi:GntR family transcriptional regulator / MocR family aminotransferase